MQAVKEDYNLDEQAKKIGLIVGVPNEIYFVQPVMYQMFMLNLLKVNG